MNSPTTEAPQSQTPAQRSAGTSNHKLLLNGSQDFRLRGLNAKARAVFSLSTRENPLSQPEIRIWCPKTVLRTTEQEFVIGRGRNASQRGLQSCGKRAKFTLSTLSEMMSPEQRQENLLNRQGDDALIRSQ